MEKRAATQPCAAFERRGAEKRRFSLECGGQDFGARIKTETKTDLQTSSFWNGKRSKLAAIAGLNPCLRESTVYCDRCGLNFLPKQSVCTRCKRVPTRYWFQFMSLVTIFVAVLCNTVLGLFLLPRLAMAKHGQVLFRGWYSFNQKAALYGWVPLALGLLAWDYFVWKEARPKVKGWFTRKLLTFSLAAGIAPLLPWWIPAGQPPGEFLSMIGRHQGVPILLAWGVVLFVIILLCIDPESRDYLLGHGRTLSIVGTGMLLLVLTMTVVGWSLTY